VRFLRYEPPEKPLVTAEEDRLSITVHDTLYDETVSLEADLLVLSAGVVPPRANNERLARLLGVSQDEDGFLSEAHPKLRPTDLPQPGLYLCGLAYGPRTIQESIAQARAAAIRAALVVARPAEPRDDVATVVPRLCSYCGLCVTHCPYGARILDEQERHARVLDHLCQGCGVCVAVCPNGASRQPALEPVGMLAMVDAALIE
jgi:heterodisulfide reductase subunit A